MSLSRNDFFPGEYAIGLTELEKGESSELTDSLLISGLTPRQQVNLDWAWFFFFIFSVWGLLPRLLMWLGCWGMERRALAGLEFQEARHRVLWRDLNRVQRGEIQSRPADGAVVLDMGGVEISTEQVRPFLLQHMRVNPEARYSLGTLDEEEEKTALRAAQEAEMGVVFLVEGWSLSPKRMDVYHRKVRGVIGANHMIRYLVISEEAEEMKQWTDFVDGLRDAETEVFQWQVS